MYHIMGYPSIEDFKNAIKYRYIDDCPITITDIEIAEDIFGKDIHALKGKTVRKAPVRVEINMIAMPEKILKLHQNITMGIDFMFVNGIPFFIMVSSKIKFITVECVASMSLQTVLKCFESLLKFYNSQGFIIENLMGNDQFELLNPTLEEEYNINFNPASANEHITEI